MKRPKGKSKFFKVTMIIEVPASHDLYPDDGSQLYLVGRMAEKAVDNNTGMVAYIQQVAPTEGS